MSRDEQNDIAGLEAAPAERVLAKLGAAAAFIGLLLALSVAVAGPSNAHGGGLDGSGGHNCNVGSCAGTYHCHRYYGGRCQRTTTPPTTTTARPATTTTTARPIITTTTVPPIKAPSEGGSDNGTLLLLAAIVGGGALLKGLLSPRLQFISTTPRHVRKRMREAARLSPAERERADAEQERAERERRERSRANEAKMKEIWAERDRRRAEAAEE